MRRKILIIPLVTLLLFTQSCGSSEDSVFDYRGHDASFTAVFPSDSDVPVTCSAEKSNEKITLSITSPERSSDISVVYDYQTVFICAGETRIPLSSDASGDMKLFFDLLFPSSDFPDSWTAYRSDDGSKTVLSCTGGKVILGVDLLPKSVVLSENRTVEIRGYCIMSEDNVPDREPKK